MIWEQYPGAPDTANTLWRAGHDIPRMRSADLVCTLNGERERGNALVTAVAISLQRPGWQQANSEQWQCLVSPSPSDQVSGGPQGLVWRWIRDRVGRQTTRIGREGRKEREESRTLTGSCDWLFIFWVESMSSWFAELCVIISSSDETKFTGLYTVSQKNFLLLLIWVCKVGNFFWDTVYILNTFIYNTFFRAQLTINHIESVAQCDHSSPLSSTGWSWLPERVTPPVAWPGGERGVTTRQSLNSVQSNIWYLV